MLKDEIVRESDHTVTLKNGKVIRKSDLAIKKQPTQKKPSPRKRDQLVEFYATKGLRKTAKPQRNVGFKSSRAMQKERNLQSKFEELDIARRNAAMNSSRETLPVFLDTYEQAEQVNQETPFLPENPGGEPTEKSVEPIAMAEAENQQLYPDFINKKPKLSGTAKRKASSPVKSPPSKKLPEIYTRQNTRPMRTRQPPKMLGERVFTSIVDLTDKNPDDPTFSSSNTPPAYPMIEATSIISAIKLLGRPMTLDELRRWTINKAANREAN